MPEQERKKLFVLTALHLLWGLILWFSISKYGLGVSTDAVHQLFGGLNLASGHGFTSYDGSFLILWPPLYPILLALVHAITGMQMLAAATVVQGAAFLGLAWCLSLLLIRIFAHRFGLAVVAAILMQVGSVMVFAAGMVGPDYVHLALVVLTLLLTGRYIESGSKRTFVALAAACTLTTLQRYLGVAAVAAAAAAILVLAQGGLGRRARNAAWLGLTIVPMATWLALTSPLYSLRNPITLEENLAWFSRSILEWFLGPIAPRQPLSLATSLFWLLALTLTTGSLLLAWHRDRPTLQQAQSGGTEGRFPLAYLLPILAYALCYALTLFGSASFAYFNKLGGRFLLPLYIPLMLLPVAAADSVLHLVKNVDSKVIRTLVTVSCYTLLAALGVSLLRFSAPLIIESHASGVSDGENAFNTRAWHQNPSIVYWRQHPPDQEHLVFSNEPDGVAFHTMHATQPAPRRTSGPYGDTLLPLERYASELFGPGLDVFLIWIQPSLSAHYYTPEDLKTAMEVVTVFESDGGSILELRPPAP
jgi:hypothetical protein